MQRRCRGGAGRVQERCRWCRGVAGYLHRLHLSKHNIRCREVQGVQAHLRLVDGTPTLVLLLYTPCFYNGIGVGSSAAVWECHRPAAWELPSHLCCSPSVRPSRQSCGSMSRNHALANAHECSVIVVSRIIIKLCASG